MIRLTIDINGRPIYTVAALNVGLVSPEDLPWGSGKDDPICRYIMKDIDREFTHNRNHGALYCANRMLWELMMYESGRGGLLGGTPAALSGGGTAPCKETTNQKECQSDEPTV